MGGHQVNTEESETVHTGEDSIGRMEVGLNEKQDYFRLLSVNSE